MFTLEAKPKSSNRTAKKVRTKAGKKAKKITKKNSKTDNQQIFIIPDGPFAR
jgi:hypothetical protein